ncbi:MAG: AAA family ATPase [Candidatus Methanomethylophilaceae archaeon]|nr:AAA family ATPase [Candidatus Methanomethylophilaceae archaeon]
MLRSITLRNFKSFEDVTLDLSAGPGSIKRCAFIYGENGSGKSTIIDAMFFVLAVSGRFVKFRPDGKSMAEDSEASKRLAKSMRMIDAEGNMSINLDVRIEGSDTKYQIEFDSEGSIVKESLEGVVNSRSGRLFCLEKGKDPYYARGLVKDARFRSDIRSGVSQYWGNRSFVRILMDDLRGSNREFLSDNLNGSLLGFMEWLDSVVVESKTFIIDNQQGILLPNGSIKLEDERHLDLVEHVISKFFSRLYSDVVKAFFDKKRNGGVIEYRLIFRKRISGKLRDVPAEWESGGTLRMISVMGVLLSSIKGRTVFVDEIDSGIHDLLITSVMEQTIPEIKGQLIAATHNTCLMDALTPNSVYVIGIDRKGYKDIRCVSSIERIQKNNSIRHKYYEGNFLGIPYVADLGMSELADEGEE